METQRGGQERNTRSSSARSLDLGLVLLFTFLAGLFVLVPPFNQTPLRIVFALPLLLFLPGYVFLSAMFPRREDLSGIERFTVSIGLSIAIFVFDGFAISVTAWRFRPAPIVYTLSLITVTLTLITFLVRWRIPKEERFSFDRSVFSRFFESLRRRSDEKPSEIERALIIALIGSIIIASGMLIYAKIAFEEEKFTALYILGEGGKAENYPKEVYLLENSSIIVGIENYEHAVANYTLEITLGGYSLYKQQIKPPLAHKEKWKEVVFFTPKHVGKRMKLEFLLYKDGSTTPHRSVHLWVDSLIDYDNLGALRKYALSDLPVIQNPDMEQESDWTFTENTGYFRGRFTNYYRLVENATVCGHVTDNRTGVGIPNARVSVSNHYGYETYNTTNENGSYVIKTIADHFWLESSAHGYTKSEAEFEIADAQTLVVNVTNDPIMVFNMTLEELSTINETIETTSPEALPEKVPAVMKGHVVNNETGLPIGNASVRIRSDYGFEWRDRTDESGYFEAQVIAGPSRIEAKAAGYMANSTGYDISGESVVTLRLTPEQSRVKGHIYDNSTGASVPDANIRLSIAGGYGKSTSSNATGYYDAKTVAGHIHMEVSKGGYFSNGTEFNVSYGETRTVDMMIAPLPPLPPPPPPATVTGYVYHNDTRLPGATVVVRDQKGNVDSTLTDRDGYFEMETVPGHLWLDVLSRVYMDSHVEFDIKSEQKVTLWIELVAFPKSTYQIDYPSGTALEKGQYGGIYQDIVSAEGVAALSFKSCDSYGSNRSAGSLFKQVLLNDLVVWEDDVAGDEGWEEVNVPLTLDRGTNRLTLRVYAKQGSRAFPLTVWWDDVRIERFEEITKEIATTFSIRDANGTEAYYPTALYLGEPAAVLAGIENNEHEPVNYTVQVKLNGELLRSEHVKLEDGAKWEKNITFVPNQIGSLLQLEFLLFKDHTGLYKAFSLWVTVDINHDNLDVLEDYVVSPLPVLINGAMDSETSEGWTYGGDNNFTGRLTDFTSVSPMHAYELSYPGETLFDPGCSARIYQNVTVEACCPATVVVSFHVRDSYTADVKGYFIKQVFLNEEVIWEDDVAGNERWQHVKVPVTLHSAVNKLTLRVYGASGSDNFPIRVWWDDVKIEPVTAIAEQMATSFFILDTGGTEEHYPEELHLGEPAEVLARIENNEHTEVNYILQIQLDDRAIKRRSKWLAHGSKWEQQISFTPDRIGERQKLDFLLFKDRVRGIPYRYFRLWVSTDMNYDNVASLLGYGIAPLPRIKDGDMRRISAWTFDYTGSFRGSRSRENASSLYSYRIEQYGASNKGDFGEIWQDIYAGNEGVVVLSFNVRDSFTETSEDAANITRRVMLNNQSLWSDDVSGRDEGYVGWVEEEYNWLEDEWIKKVPGVKSGWMHVDVPVYLYEGDNTLILGVYAEEDTEELPVNVYWDDVEIKAIERLVNTGDDVRMRRYGW